MAEIDSRQLRNALGCYATGVAVITTRSATQEHIGVTVNSFASVSLQPPLILFSLARAANTLAVFRQARHFSVNILSHTQEKLSNTFARPSSASWAELQYTEGDNGCALFAGSLAQLECNKAQELDGGDHIILLGEVTRVHQHEAADPLLFYRGRYGTYTRDPWSKLPPPDGSLSDFTVPGWG
jgi:3-hydroxy-9,10-secoandrosta-1,3,5(10)-triene-9,17-dione monooxygenase reductase component